MMPQDARALEQRIVNEAYHILHRETPNQMNYTSFRRFKSMFGTSPYLATMLLIAARSTDELGPQHLLWALMFLKVYSTEAIHAY